VQQCFGGFFFLWQPQLNLSLVYSTPISSALSFSHEEGVSACAPLWRERSFFMKKHLL
jgi:hypothetical protein